MTDFSAWIMKRLDNQAAYLFGVYILILNKLGILDASWMIIIFFIIIIQEKDKHPFLKL